MKITGKMWRLLALLAAVAMLASFAACGQSSEPAEQTSTAGSTTTAAAATTTAEPAKEPVILKVLVYSTNTADWNAGHDSPVQQEIKRVTGVTLEQQEVSEDQFNVILAGGDLPDMVRFDQVKHRKALVEGNHLIAMDELLQTNGGEILKNIPDTLEYSKLNWSEGKNKIYSIPTQVGPDMMVSGIGDSIAPVLRWDYYKEIGAPKFTNENELLDILKQMVEKHPTTEDGKKTYGVSMWHDWGNWSYFQPLFYFSGYMSSMQSCARSVEPGSLIVDAAATEESFWRAVKFYYNANKMDLLDPDALTMKYADFEAKGIAGQILFAGADWPFDKFNQAHAAEGKGYMPIPMEKGYQWHGDMASLGWTSKCFGITTDCKTPDRAMDLLNYLWSYDGCRTMYSGVEGVHWNMADGKPRLTDEVIALFGKKEDAWKALNIQADANIMGLAPNVAHPEDGEFLNLFNTAQILSRDLNPLMKDFSDFYKVSYPGEVFKNLIDQGKNKNKAAENAFANAFPYDQSDELKRIDGNLKDLMAKYAAKCILSRSDEEYDKNKAEAIKEFEKAGAKQNFESRSNWYLAALEDAKKYAK